MSNISQILIAILLAIQCILLYYIRSYLYMILEGRMTIQLTVKELEEAVNDFINSDESEVSEE